MSFLAGPIFAKEMVEISRRRRYYAMRVLYGVVLFLAVLRIFQSHDFVFGQTSIGGMAAVADQMFHAVARVQMAAILLFVPVILCAVIAGEREKQTLDLLFTTQLADRQIVLGKLLSRFAVLVLLILCALPVMSLITLFGGIDPQSLWRILGATLLTILFTGAIAIYCSSATISPMTALGRTYWRMALWLLCFPAVIYFVGVRLTEWLRDDDYLLYASASIVFTNPIGIYAVAEDTSLYREFARDLGFWFFPASFAPTAAWSVILIWRAIRLLRVPPIGFGSFMDRLGLVRKWRRSSDRFLGKASPGRRVSERLWFGVAIQNPFWVRARRSVGSESEGHIRRLQTGAWMAAVFFILYYTVEEPGWIINIQNVTTFLIVAWIGVILVTAFMAATSFVGDRRHGLLEQVMMTPLSGREIIDGSLLASWQHVQRIYWLPWMLCAVFGAANIISFEAIAWSLLLVTLFVVLVAIYGTACSLCAKTTASALTLSILFPFLSLILVDYFKPIFVNVESVLIWAGSAVFIIVTKIIVRRRDGVLAVGSYLLAVHLALATFASIAYLCWIALDPWSEPRNPRTTDLKTLLPSRALMLAASILYMRWWVVRNFDRLAGRFGDSLRHC